MLDYSFNLLANVPGEIAFVAIIVILLLCGLGLPLPEEFPLLAAGYLAYQGVMPLSLTIFITLLAIVGGDSMLFGIGFHFGHRIFEIPVFKKLLTPPRMKKVNHYFHRYGSGVVFVARFMAGVRGTVFVTAGILRMRFKRFLILDGIAALVSVPLLVFIAYHFGAEIDQGLAMIRKTGWNLMLLMVAAVLSFFLGLHWIKARRAKTFEAENLKG